MSRCVKMALFDDGIPLNIPQNAHLTVCYGRLFLLLNVTPAPAVGVTQPETYINWAQWMEKQLDAHAEELIKTEVFAGHAGPQGEPAAVTDQN